MRQVAGNIEIGDDGQVSPWATDQPVAPAPIEFRWLPADTGGDRDAHPEREPAGSGPAAEGSDAEAADGGPGGPYRSRTIAIAVVVAAALAVGVLVVVMRGDRAVDIGSGLESAVSDPASASTASVSDPDQVPDNSLLTPVTTVRVTGVDGGGGAGAEGLDAAWTDETIDVPPSLRRLREVTTIVAIGADGVFQEIDLPTGQVRSLALARTDADSQLSAGATSTLLTQFTGRGDSALLVRAGQPPIDVDLGESHDQLIAIAGSDEYVGNVYRFDGSATSYQQIRVLADGSTSLVDLGDGELLPWLRQYSPTGSTLITDAGGIYEVGDDGSVQRVSTGTLVASSSHHLFVRECSETYECEFVVVDAVTGERTAANIGEMNPLFNASGIQVSPDGTFLRYLRYGTSTSEVLVDLASGAETTSPYAGGDDLAPVWAPDSSGVFHAAAASGFQFTDRSTGAITLFGEALGPIRSVAVRMSDGAVAEPAAPLTSGLAVIGLGRDGGVVQIDIDTGAVISSPAPPLASGSPAYVFVDDGGATIASYDNVPSIRFDAADGSARLTQSSAPGGPMIVGPFTNTVWQPRARVSPDDPLTLELVNSLGEELGATIDVGSASDTALLGSDGQGGVLVQSEFGGVYSLSVDGSTQRLTTGQVIALGPTVGYLRECDGAFTCGVFRLDRATGDRELIEISAFELAGADESSGSPIGQNVSPDGDVALIRVSGFGTAWTMVDVAAGTTLPVVGAAVASPLVWSADSQWALYLSNDVLRLYDRASGRLRTLDNLPDLKAFGVV